MEFFRNYIYNYYLPIEFNNNVEKLCIELSETLIKFHVDIDIQPVDTLNSFQLLLQVFTS